MQGLATSAGNQAMSENTYQEKLNAFALHQTKAATAFTDLIPEIRARPPASVLVELEDLKREMANARSKNEVLSAQCAYCEDQVVAMKTENKRIEEELKVARDREKELEARISRLTRKNKILSAQCVSYWNEITDLEFDGKKTKEALVVANGNEMFLEAAASGLSVKCDNYESHIAALEADCEKRMEVAHNKQKQLEATISELTHQNEALSAQCASYEEERLLFYL